jgi:hypothetical protein
MPDRRQDQAPDGLSPTGSSFRIQGSVLPTKSSAARKITAFERQIQNDSSAEELVPAQPPIQARKSVATRPPSNISSAGASASTQQLMTPQSVLDTSSRWLQPRKSVATRLQPSVSRAEASNSTHQWKYTSSTPPVSDVLNVETLVPRFARKTASNTMPPPAMSSARKLTPIFSTTSAPPHGVCFASNTVDPPGRSSALITHRKSSFPSSSSVSFAQVSSTYHLKNIFN